MTKSNIQQNQSKTQSNNDECFKSDDELLLSNEAAAKFLNVSISWLYRNRHSSDPIDCLRYEKGKIFYVKRDLKDWINRHRGKPQSTRGTQS